MSEFKREQRYIVIKIKDLDVYQKPDLLEFIADNEIPTRESVVVESDWQIYDKVWEMVEAEWADRHQ